MGLDMSYGIADLEDSGSGCFCGDAHGDLAVKAPCPPQGWIQRIWPVCRTCMKQACQCDYVAMAEWTLQPVKLTTDQIMSNVTK